MAYHMSWKAIGDEHMRMYKFIRSSKTTRFEMVEKNQVEVTPREDFGVLVSLSVLQYLVLVR